MYIETEGIVLREAPVGNNGKLLTVLTPGNGKITAFAKGARSLKSALAPSSNIFTYSKFVLFKNKDRYVINSAEAIELFFELRSDVLKLSLAQYFLELTAYATREDIESSGFVKLLTNTLFVLSKKELPLKTVKGVFELKLLELAGFMPDLDACRSCGKTVGDIFYLNRAEGYIVCGSCGSFSNNFGYLKLLPGTLAAMRHVLYGDFSRIFSFKLAENTIDNFETVIEEFLEEQAEHHKFKTLEFYKSII